MKGSLPSLVESADDEFTFEHKEYLISVEKEALQPSTDVPLPKPSYKRPAPSVSHVKKEEFVKPRSKEEQKDVDVMAMLKPRKVTSNPLSTSVDDLLSLLSSPSQSTASAAAKPPDDASSHKSHPSTESSCSRVKNSSLPRLLSIPSVSTPPEKIVLTHEVKKPYDATPTGDSLDLSLPCFSDVSSHNLAFYSPPPFDTSSIASYAHSTHLLLQSVLRFTLFTASQQSLPHAPLNHRLFTSYAAQGHTPSLTDIAPPLPWLAENATSFQSASLAIWPECSLHVKREEWLPAKKKKVAVEPRFFLTVPTLTTSKKADAGSLLNSLLVIFTSDQPCFFRSLWHGCTTNHMLEVAPLSRVDEASLPDQSHLLVVQCGSVLFLLLFHDRSTWK